MCVPRETTCIPRNRFNNRFNKTDYPACACHVKPLAPLQRGRDRIERWAGGSLHVCICQHRANIHAGTCMYALNTNTSHRGGRGPASVHCHPMHVFASIEWQTDLAHEATSMKQDESTT